MHQQHQQHQQQLPYNNNNSNNNNNTSNNNYYLHSQQHQQHQQQQLQQLQQNNQQQQLNYTQLQQHHQHHLQHQQQQQQQQQRQPPHFMDQPLSNASMLQMQQQLLQFPPAAHARFQHLSNNHNNNSSNSSSSNNDSNIGAGGHQRLDAILTDSYAAPSPQSFSSLPRRFGSASAGSVGPGSAGAVSSSPLGAGAAGNSNAAASKSARNILGFKLKRANTTASNLVGSPLPASEPTLVSDLPPQIPPFSPSTGLFPKDSISPTSPRQPHPFPVTPRSDHVPIPLPPPVPRPEPTPIPVFLSLPRPTATPVPLPQPPLRGTPIPLPPAVPRTQVPIPLPQSLSRPSPVPFPTQGQSIQPQISPAAEGSRSNSDEDLPFAYPSAGRFAEPLAPLQYGSLDRRRQATPGTRDPEFSTTARPGAIPSNFRDESTPMRSVTPTQRPKLMNPMRLLANMNAQKPDTASGIRKFQSLQRPARGGSARTDDADALATNDWNGALREVATLGRRPTSPGALLTRRPSSPTAILGRRPSSPSAIHGSLGRRPSAPSASASSGPIGNDFNINASSSHPRFAEQDSERQGDVDFNNIVGGPIAMRTTDSFRSVSSSSSGDSHSSSKLPGPSGLINLETRRRRRQIKPESFVEGKSDDEEEDEEPRGQQTMERFKNRKSMYSVFTEASSDRNRDSTLTGAFDDQSDDDRYHDELAVVSDDENDYQDDYDNLHGGQSKGVATRVGSSHSLSLEAPTLTVSSDREIPFRNSNRRSFGEDGDMRIKVAPQPRTLFASNDVVNKMLASVEYDSDHSPSGSPTAPTSPALSFSSLSSGRSSPILVSARYSPPRAPKRMDGPEVSAETQRAGTAADAGDALVVLSTSDTDGAGAAPGSASTSPQLKSSAVLAAKTSELSLAARLSNVVARHTGGRKQGKSGAKKSRLRPGSPRFPPEADAAVRKLESLMDTLELENDDDGDVEDDDDGDEDDDDDGAVVLAEEEAKVTADAYLRGGGGGAASAGNGADTDGEVAFYSDYVSDVERDSDEDDRSSTHVVVDAHEAAATTHAEEAATGKKSMGGPHVVCAMGGDGKVRQVSMVLRGKSAYDELLERLEATFNRSVG